jgi:hypothetical protein
LQNEDLIRELQKVFETITRMTSHLQKQSEANAQLHMSDKVMYPPLTSAAILATESMQQLISRLYAERNEDGKD